jgi:Sulfotransferase family
MDSARGRLPDFFVVGHAKSGTTALHAMLAQHPQIHLGLKEPRFFASELRERDMPRPNKTPQTLAEYKQWFSGAGPQQLIGDISPDYLWSHDAAALIAEAQPEARIIAILREPASFLRSLHRQWLRHYVETETDFRRALELEQPRREGRQMPLNTYWPKALFYSDHVRYVDQLRRFHQHFARERVLVLIYDDYRRDNDATVRSVLRFLDVDDSVSILARQSNESVHVQSPRVHAALRRLTVADSRPLGLLKRSLKALTPMAQRQRLLQTVRKRVVFGEPAPADEELLLELRHRFKPEVSALSEYLDRDLVGLWGYDELI